MNCYFTKGRRGTFMTNREPIIHPIDYIGELDVYPVHGESIDVRNLCEDGVRLMINTRRTGLVLPSLVPVLGRFTWVCLEPEKLIPLSLSSAQASTH